MEQRWRIGATNSLKELAQDDAKAPDIDCLAVLLLHQYDLWWSVMPRADVRAKLSLSLLALRLLLPLDLSDHQLPLRDADRFDLLAYDA